MGQADKLKNGDLLTAAENAGFEVFLTTDKNIRYQQDLTRRKIAIVVLGRQQWPQLRAHERVRGERSKSTSAVCDAVFSDGP